MRREDTAISSADVLLVTAMNRRMSIRTAPPLPRRVIAAAGATRPAPTWASVNALGYVGKEGEDVRAAQPKPIAVDIPKGTPYLMKMSRGVSCRF